MTSHYETIRAALEGAKTTARICVLGGLAKETDDALTALAELERMAGEPVAWRRDGFTFFVGDGWDVPPDGASPLYAAPPIPKVAARADAEIAALKRSCEDWEAQMRTFRETENAEIAKLRRELKETNMMFAISCNDGAIRELQRDADRLNWLAENPREGTIRLGLEFKTATFWGVSAAPGVSLRAAIDAARGGE